MLRGAALKVGVVSAVNTVPSLASRSTGGALGARRTADGDIPCADEHARPAERAAAAAAEVWGWKTVTSCSTRWQQVPATHRRRDEGIGEF